MCKTLNEPDCVKQIPCYYNFYEEPKGEEKNICTHLKEYNKDRKVVNECKNMNMNECMKAMSTCVYYFDEAPSEKQGACTHLAADRKDA